MSKIGKIIILEIMNKLLDQESTEQDKTLMIKLTPREILNIAMMGAEYWSRAKEAKTPHSMEYVCKNHVDIAIEILRQTDPDRFIYQN